MTLKSSAVYSSPVSGFTASRSCAYSLYVIASAASISRFSRATMSNCCCTSSTSEAGSRPSLPRAAKISYSLPKPQLPIFLPWKSAGDSMPESAHATCKVPERWNTWAMSTMPAPCSRDASALGTQARAKSAPPCARTVCGTMSTAPSRMVTSMQLSS